MKVKVSIANSNKASDFKTDSIEVTVGSTDTVMKVQQLIATVTKTDSFPDQKVIFAKQVLSSKQRLCDCGIKEGDALEYTFQASDQTLVNQVSELLGDKSISLEELGLLYTYRYALTFDDALKAVGQSDIRLRGFLESQKCFACQGNFVKLLQDSAKTVQPVSPALCPIEENKSNHVIEVRVTVEVRVPGRSPASLIHDEDEDDVHVRLRASDTVSRSKEIIAASEQVPFLDRDLYLGNTKLGDEQSLEAAGVKNGCHLLMVVHASETALASQLEKLLAEHVSLSVSDLGLHYCNRFGTPISQALRTLGLRASLERFLEGHTEFSLRSGCLTLTNGPTLTTPASKQEECDALDIVDYLVDLLCGASFLNMSRVEKECNVAGKVNTTLFINGLPPVNQKPLLQGLQKAVASTLNTMRDDEPSIDFAKLVGDTVKVQVDGTHTVSMKLAAA
jgi:uncharacterized ubiquitin-like protein YukD